MSEWANEAEFRDMDWDSGPFLVSALCRARGQLHAEYNCDGAPAPALVAVITKVAQPDSVRKRHESKGRCLDPLLDSDAY